MTPDEKARLHARWLEDRSAFWNKQIESMREIGVADADIIAFLAGQLAHIQAEGLVSRFESMATERAKKETKQ